MKEDSFQTPSVQDMDDNRLGKRLNRYLEVMGLVKSGLLPLAVEKVFNQEADHAAHAKALTTLFGTLKGPVMKIAQMLATIPDALPAEYALEFLSLQADAPPMGWPFVRRRMQAELGEDWQSCFKEFTPQAVAAASLGQVHKAIDLQGRILACKLQYPNMASIVEADLAQLKLILKVYEATLGALKTEEVFQEISDRLQEELDYEKEAESLKKYTRIFAQTPFVHIPEVVDSLSTKRLLTMTWLEGRRLKEIINDSQEQRNRWARHLFLAWYKPFYHHGLLHGDPHLGNYTFNEDGTVNILDFGCLRSFSSSFVQGVLDLYQALEKDDKDLAYQAYQSWGFKNLTPEILEVLNWWAKLLYDPILDNRVRPLQDDHRGLYGREVADKVHTSLRKLGGVTPPRAFVFMDRAAVGIGSACMHLRAEINWYELYHHLIEDFSSRTF